MWMVFAFTSVGVEVNCDLGSVENGEGEALSTWRALLWAGVLCVGGESLVVGGRVCDQSE